MGDSPFGVRRLAAAFQYGRICVRRGSARFEKRWQAAALQRLASRRQETPEAVVGISPARQQEIDASIARRAETEMLYDQPYEDHKRVRVTGPFTVESLSPHRTISVEEKKRRAEVGDAASGLKIKVHGPDEFGQMILDNLRTAGVQNTFKKERLKFDCLQPYAGQWIHGEGMYTEQPSASGKSPHPNPLPEGGDEDAWPSASGRNTAPSARNWSRRRPRRPCRASASTSDRLRLRLRSPRLRRGEALWQAGGAAHPHEPRPDNGRALEKDRIGQPVHGLWRAGPGCSASRRTGGSS